MCDEPDEPRPGTELLLPLLFDGLVVGGLVELTDDEDSEWWLLKRSHAPRLDIETVSAVVELRSGKSVGLADFTVAARAATGTLGSTL